MLSLPWRLAVMSCVAFAAHWYAFQYAGFTNDFRDAQFHQVYEHVAASSISKYGQLPLWDPYSCGGMYALGNPQIRFASPTLLLSVLFGGIRAQALTACLMTTIGMEGTYRWFRQCGCSASSSVLAALVPSLVGHYGVAYFFGWINFYGFHLVPWILWGAGCALRGKISGVMVAAIATAWMIGFGGTYAPLMTIVFAAPVMLGQLYFRPALRQELRETSKLLALLGVFALGLSAVRTLPVLDVMRASGRVMAGLPGSPLPILGGMLLMHAPPSGGAISSAGLFFVGPIAIVSLGALGIFSLKRNPRFAIATLVTILLMVWLAAGYNVRPSLFSWLRALPIYSTLRYPERYLFFATSALALLGAQGLTEVQSWRHSEKPLMRRAGWALSISLTVSLIAGVAHQVVSLQVTTRELARTVLPEFNRDSEFRQARGNRWMGAHYLPINRGSISCGEAYPVPMSTDLRGDLPNEEYLENPDLGTVRRSAWTPNRINLDVTVSDAASLKVNQNWHPGWRSNVGEVVNRNGLIGVRLPAGHHQVTLRFVPWSAIAGFAISLLTVLLMIGIGRGRVHRLFALVIPIAMALSAVRASAWMPKSEPVNPDGTPIVGEHHPKIALNATFELPVELVGADLPKSRDVDNVTTFDLYWKVTGQVARSTAIFVHVVPKRGNLVTLDREVIGGTFFLSDAPRGVVLRDVFGSGALEPGRYEVYAGLWDPSSGKRFAVTSKGASDNRVRIGEFELE